VFISFYSKRELHMIDMDMKVLNNPKDSKVEILVDSHSPMQMIFSRISSLISDSTKMMIRFSPISLEINNNNRHPHLQAETMDLVVSVVLEVLVDLVDSEAKMDKIMICLEDLVDSVVEACNKCPSPAAAQWVVAAAQANLYRKRQS